jgi:hypothetical protein
MGHPAPVDQGTRFGIASNTKLFTATALALLVEEGKLEWDAPVVRYLPWFAMYDPYVTRELSVRDLLVHRSGLGLGAGDLLHWPPSTYDRKEIARRLRFIPPATSFRSAYAYDNVLYIVAGEVIEAVSGQSWEAFVRSLGVKPPDYPERFEQLVNAQREKLREEKRQAAASRDSTSGPSLPLAGYAGTYRDPWYGDVTIAQEGGGLVIRFTRTPSLVGDLIHWQHDSFLARWRDRELRADAYATFALNHDGSIERLRMVPSSPAVDFSYDFQDLVLRPVSPDSGKPH